MDIDYEQIARELAIETIHKKNVKDNVTIIIVGLSRGIKLNN
jgi:hypothetical protein